MSVLEFLEESNRIEGILRPASPEEVAAFEKFMRLRNIELLGLCELVRVFQPNAKLRASPNLNVRVGSHIPPSGGMHIVYRLEDLLQRINEGVVSAYTAHVEYETLHPFTDCNGRSGRMLWWRMMGGSPLGFLHKWYYQSLENSR